MKDEALKLALEALEWDSDFDKRQIARAAIKKALSAPVQEPAPENFIDALKFDVAMRDAAQQEYERGFIDGMQRQAQSSVDRAVNAMSQRQWVELTDEEVYPLANEHLHHQIESYEVSGIYNLARAIEARLKELNT
jgi:hypothetical protein